MSKMITTINEFKKHLESMGHLDFDPSGSTGTLNDTPEPDYSHLPANERPDPKGILNLNNKIKELAAEYGTFVFDGKEYYFEVAELENNHAYFIGKEWFDNLNLSDFNNTWDYVDSYDHYQVDISDKPYDDNGKGIPLYEW